MILVLLVFLKIASGLLGGMVKLLGGMAELLGGMVLKTLIQICKEGKVKEAKNSL